MQEHLYNLTLPPKPPYILTPCPVTCNGPSHSFITMFSCLLRSSTFFIDVTWKITGHIKCWVHSSFVDLGFEVISADIDLCEGITVAPVGHQLPKELAWMLENHLGIQQQRWLNILGRKVEGLAKLDPDHAGAVGDDNPTAGIVPLLPQLEHSAKLLVQGQHRDRDGELVRSY